MIIYFKQNVFGGLKIEIEYQMSVNILNSFYENDPSTHF